MAYDEGLAERVEIALGELDVVGKAMFGGVGYLLHGNMVCGVLGDALIVRVGADAYEEALAQPHTREFDTRGRPMRGWVMVDPEGYASDQEMDAWIKRAVDFTMTLPPK